MLFLYLLNLDLLILLFTESLFTIANLFIAFTDQTHYFVGGFIKILFLGLSKIISKVTENGQSIVIFVFCSNFVFRIWNDESSFSFCTQDWIILRGSSLISFVRNLS